MGTLYKGQIGLLRANAVRLSNKAGDSAAIIQPVGAIPWKVSGVRGTYRATTSSIPLEIIDSGETTTNDGAAGIVTIALPDATVEGIVFRFVRIANFDFRIDPEATSSIKYSGGTMATGEYLILGSVGAKLHLISDSAGDWIATYEFGTLTEETP